MKRLLTLMMMCIVLVGYTSNSFAQSTAVQPYDGATHTYTFNNVEANAAYEFYVSTSADYTNTGAITSAFGTFVGAAGVETGTIGTSAGSASVQIKWANNASATAGGFYLYLKVTAQGSSCGVGNYKAVHIMPQANAFNLAVVDVDSNDATCADITGLLPVINTDDTNLTDYSHYNPGTTTLNFKITRSSATNAWSTKFDITCSESSVNYTYTAGAVTGNQANATDIIVGGISADDQIVTIVVTNTPGVSPVFTIQLTEGSDDVTHLTDTDLSTTDAVADHTINLMPKIGDFVGE